MYNHIYIYIYIIIILIIYPVAEGLRRALSHMSLLVP